MLWFYMTAGIVQCVEALRQKDTDRPPEWQVSTLKRHLTNGIIFSYCDQFRQLESLITCNSNFSCSNYSVCTLLICSGILLFFNQRGLLTTYQYLVR